MNHATFQMYGKKNGIYALFINNKEIAIDGASGPFSLPVWKLVALLEALPFNVTIFIYSIMEI